MYPEYLTDREFSLDRLLFQLVGFIKGQEIIVR